MYVSVGGLHKSAEAYALLVSATLHKAIKPYLSAYWLHAHAQTETYMYMCMCVVTVDMRCGWRCSHSHEFEFDDGHTATSSPTGPTYIDNKHP